MPNRHRIASMCLTLMAVLVVAGAVLFTPVSDAGSATPEIPKSTGSRCLVPAPPSEDNSGGDHPISGLPQGVTSFVSGLTRDEAPFPLGLVTVEKNNVSEWNPAPSGPVAAHGQNQWCDESYASIFGGASVKLVYSVKDTAPGPGLGFDFVTFEANVTVTNGGSESCHVHLTNPRSTTRCSVQVVHNGQRVIATPSGRPYLAVDFTVHQ